MSSKYSTKQNVGTTYAEIFTEMGEDPFKVVFEKVFEEVSSIYARTTGVMQSRLFGIEFRDGGALSLHQVMIQRKNDIPQTRKRMLAKFPIVVDVLEAWGAPVSSVLPSMHPQRRDLVLIVLHTSDTAGISQCLANPVTRKLERGEVIQGGIGGELGRPETLVATGTIH